MQTGKTILFIDDDKHLTRIVSDFLKHEHFDVHTAASAEEGLRLLQTLKPDLIVLDISMPGIGGIGLLKRIANPDGSLHHPVLVLTARAVMKEFFDTVAVDGFLPKPCSPAPTTPAACPPASAVPTLRPASSTAMPSQNPSPAPPPPTAAPPPPPTAPSTCP